MQKSIIKSFVFLEPRCVIYYLAVEVPKPFPKANKFETSYKQFSTNPQMIIPNGAQIHQKLSQNRTKINPKLKKWWPWGGLGGHGAQGRLQVATPGKTRSPFGTLLAQNGRPEGHFRDPWKS